MLRFGWHLENIATSTKKKKIDKIVNLFLFNVYHTNKIFN